MPFLLAGFAAVIAGMTATELVIAAAVIVTTAIAVKGLLTGVKASPQDPATTFTTDPLTLTISADAPRRIAYGKTRISGVLAYINVSGDGHENLWMVIVVAAHRIQEISEIYFNGKPGPDVAAGFYTWHYYDGSQTTADPELMNTFAEWTADCILQGCAYAIVKLTYDKTVWSGGRPDISFDLKGKNDIYDPRDGLTKFSNNWALCVANYLRSPDGIGALDSEIDWETISVAADISDQLPAEMAASLCDGRYTVDGVIELSTKNGDILTAMVAAGAGTLIYTEGVYRLYAGAMVTPQERVLTADDLRGSISLQPRTPTDQSFNSVKGTFLDSTQGWVFSDFPPVIGEEYVTQDGGTRIFHDIVLQFTTSPITAQKLATIFLRRARLEKTISLPCKWTCFNYEVWDVIPITLPQLGWENVLFQITDWKMTPPNGKNPGGIDLTLVEYSDDIYSDDLTLKPIQGAGVINVPNVTVPNPLSVLFATSNDSTIDAQGRPRVRFDWPFSPDIYAVGYELAYGQYPFTPVDDDYVFISGRNTGSTTVGPLIPGATYIGYVRVVNSFDRRSEATASNTVVATATGSGTPADVVGFAATEVGTQFVDLNWTLPTGGGTEAQTEIRWAATNDINASVVVNRVALPTTTVRLLRETSNGYYFAAFINNGGNYGAFTPGLGVNGRAPGTVMQTLALNRAAGDLTNAIWISDTQAVSKSQRLASELGWEVFDMMVPQPFPHIEYWAKNPVFIPNDTTLQVSGSLGWNRAPGVPGTLPIVNASAQTAYFGTTVVNQGTFTLDHTLGSANVKTGFVADTTDPAGVVFTGFNGLLEEV